MKEEKVIFTAIDGEEFEIGSMIPRKEYSNYYISAEDSKRINEWYGELKPKLLEKYGHPRIPGEVYYGAIGGGLTYSFTPTGLGVILKVKEHFSQEELDLTDYDSW